MTENFNFAYDVMDEIALREPSKRALVYKSCKGDTKQFTYGEMSEYSSRIANVFRSKGIGRGDRVMLIMKRRYEFWFTILALHKLGAVAIPTSNMVAENDISYRIINANVKAIVCANDPYICKTVKHAIGQRDVMTFVAGGEEQGFHHLNKEMMEADHTFERAETKSTDMMLLYFTSGTTGEPKAVIHDYSYPLAHIITARDWHGVVDNGLHFAVADSGWAKSAWGKMYGQWICGCAVMVYDYEQFYANEILSILEDYKVTSFCAPPTIYKYFLRENLEDYDLSLLEQVVTAGEPMPIEVMRQFKERTGLQIRCGYGQTETTLITAVMVGEEQIKDSIGRVSPMYRVAIIDDEGNAVEPGELGELVVYKQEDGSLPIGVFGGYLNDDALYQEVWDGGVYHTKDKAYMDEEGNVFFVSRTDDVIKSSGYRIGPAEVENVIMKHPAVFECAVTGFPSETRGNIVKATIVLQEGYIASSALKVEIQDYVKAKTAMYKYPRKIEFWEELPKTVSGKIQREAIRQIDIKRSKQNRQK